MTKKLFVGIIVFSIVLCCLGCYFDNEKDLRVQSADNVQTNEVADHGTSDVPYVLVFDSFEQIGTLKNMIEEDENTVIGYLNSNNYSMNGITSKRDIVELFNDIGDLCMLHLDSISGYDLVSISYYVSYNYVMSTYKNGNDIVRFICYIGNSKETTAWNGASVHETEIVSSFNIENKKFDLHNVDDENSPFALAGSIGTSNSQITILFSDNNEEIIRNKIGGNIVSSTLLELIEK